MPWNDRLRVAAYTSPSGERITFDYEDVRKSFDKKTANYDFPDADGTYIQDLGNTGRIYPFRVIFWGDDYDLIADNFETMLKEVGPGKLEHPIYGVVDVVPFGTVTRRDDLKSAGNQAIFEVSFWETIGLIYPTSQDDPASNVIASIDEFNASSAEEFEKVTSLESAVEQASFKSVIQGLINNIESGLQTIADTQEAVKRQFDNIVDSINNGIDLLIGQPLTLAMQTIQLIQSPARALTNIQARLDAYGNLLSSVLDSVDAISIPGYDSRNENEFRTKDINVLGYVSGLILSSVNNQFFTQSDALTAADTILTQFENVTEWRDNNFDSLSIIDEGEAYQKIQESVALAAGFLVQISFTLKQERKIILTRNRTIIDLVAELYGSVDDQLDFFITSNNLTGSEILELPKGKEIVFYV